jgi:hypothetical protein
MAKNTGRLAGLAALAGAAYMMSRGKDKNKDAEFQKGREDQMGRLVQDNRPARPMDTTTALKTPAQSIKDADKSGEAASAAANAIGTGTSNISTSSVSPISQQQSGTLTKGPDTSTPDLNEKRNAPINPKNPAAQQKNIVSKKQLDDYKKRFGQDKTLRDYMNAQRALKNRPIKPIALPEMRMGGKVKKMASGGMTSKVSSASRRADGIATRGKTKCKMY